VFYSARLRRVFVFFAASPTELAQFFSPTTKRLSQDQRGDSERKMEFFPGENKGVTKEFRRSDEINVSTDEVPR